MSNFLYTKSKTQILNGNINFSSDSLKLIATNASYIPSQNNDEFVSDIPGSSIIFRSANLANKIVSSGTFDADDLEINGYAGTAFNAIILYKDTGSDLSSRLLCYINQAAGLPFAGASSETDVIIFWNNGSDKILSL